jgi:hypothetical protein
MSNKILHDYILNIIIGEDIQDKVSSTFNTIKIYVKDDNINSNLYAYISIPYIINHVEFLDIEDDPRYYLYEGYDFETKGYKHMVEIKPLGERKGVYRILNGQNIKVCDINPIFEVEQNKNQTSNIKKISRKNKKWH